MATKKTLLEKYEIPVNHLEFDYIKNCTDAREVEKIVLILRSGEEGYFPDLTKCAEDKLREIKPNSRLLFCEDRLRQQILGENELHPVMQWSENIREQDNKLSSMCRHAAEMFKTLGLSEIRIGGRISQKTEEQSGPNLEQATTSRAARISKPIAATDYHKWEQYDPEEELLRMDLDEERVKENVERKNRINTLKSRPTPLISELAQKEQKTLDPKEKLTDVEIENLCLEYRIRGNDFYRAKEYENAIHEYDQAINYYIDPQTGAYAYSNRAIANMKLKRYNEAIIDCEKCLKLQPDNLKALLRLAEIKLTLNLKSEAYHTYATVMEYYPENRTAARAMQDILDDLHGLVPPRTATRIHIAEEVPTTSKAARKRMQDNVADGSFDDRLPYFPDIEHFDYANLIKPKKEKVNKIYAAAKRIHDLSYAKKQSAKNQPAKTQPPGTDCTPAQPDNKDEPVLRLPNHNTESSGKVLIEEVKKN